MSEELAKKNLEELLKHKNDNKIQTTNLFGCIEIILQENKELKDNWNRVKEYLNERTKYFKNTLFENAFTMDDLNSLLIKNKLYQCEILLDKMEELENANKN